MIKDTIEKAKDFIQDDPDMRPENKLKLQRLLTDIRGELMTTDYLNTQTLARLDVYAEVANKILDKLAALKEDRY